MGIYTPPATWISAWHHEGQRQAEQRAASANRRAAAIEDGKENVLTYSAVASILGITPQAINAARNNAAARPDRPPVGGLGGYLELDLPRTDTAILTQTEWDALPDDQQTDAARIAHDAWTAQATVCDILARLCYASSEATAYSDMCADEDTPKSRLAAARDHLHESADPVVAGQPTPEILLPDLRFGTDHMAHACLLRDMAEGLFAHARRAWRESDHWAHLAGVSAPTGPE